MEGYETVDVRVDDGIGHLVLNRPDHFNAMNGQMMQVDLPGAWSQLAADDNVRCIVVSARGENFCTGNDMKETAELGGENIPQSGTWPVVRLTAIHNDVWKPVVTAVQGMCAGGGLYFLAHSDINVSAQDATYFDPHVDVGAAAAIEAVELLTRVSLPVALRMVCMGRNERMSADRALAVGLVDEVVPSGAQVERAVRLARVIADKSPSALMRSKLALWQAADRLRPDALANSWEIVRRQWRDPDAQEGPAAFVEKRPAVWSAPPSASSL